MTATGSSVLIVDDDNDIRSMVELTLLAEGYRVATACEGREALACVAREMPEAIVLDLRMPGMDGWEFARVFRERYGHRAPIMVMTAAQSASQHAAELGAAGYLDKPFDTADLIQQIEQLLKRNEPAPAAAAGVHGDAAVVQRAIDGDAAAFQQLYEKHAQDVYRYLYYRLGNAHDAEDLAQQVFVNAWVKMRSYRPGSSPVSSWLLAIARNLLITFYRRRRMSHSLDDPAVYAALPDSRAEFDPVEEAERRWRYDAVRDAIDTLPPDYRKVLLLRFVLNLQHRDIAAALRRTEGAVRILQLRALRKLHRRLREVSDFA